MYSENLQNAFLDYRYLLDRNYPEKATIKLVGDKYQLSGEERSILYRGISSKKSSDYRRSKKTLHLKPGKIFIDTYNILFTLANYLNGRPVFIADDGFLRDAGELRGRFSKKKLLERTRELLFNFIELNGNKEYYLYIDQPVSNSGRLAAEINEFLSIKKITGQAQTFDSPDHRIILKASAEDTVCSGDSIIIEKTKASVFDLSFYILQKEFQAEVIWLEEFLYS
ncbi:MAG: DUF434 domain-containing protein [Bacteroidales bacterium]